MRLLLTHLALLACLPLLPAAPGSETQAPVSIESMVREADQIVMGEVVAVHALYQRGRRISKLVWPERTVLLAEIRVERVLIGPEDMETTWALAARVVGAERELEKLSSPWEAGDRGVFFLERSAPLRGLASAIGERLEKRTGGARVFAQHGPGRVPFGCADGQEVPVLQGLGAPADIIRAEPRERVARLLGWIDAVVDQVTPSLRVGQFGVMLGSTDSVSVEGDGSWIVERRGMMAPDQPPLSSSRGKLDSDQLAEFFELVDQERFFALPDDVGIDSAPCVDWVSIELRTRRGSKEVRFFDSPAGPDETARWEHLKAILEALPSSPWGRHR